MFDEGVGEMKLRFALFVLSLVIGVGACGGSMLAFMSIEPLRKGQSFAGLESSMLQGTPFTTFLIPGVFLLIVLGLGNLLAAIRLWRNQGYHGELLLSICLVIWIIVQVILLRGGNVLHLIFLVLGLLQLGVAAYCIKHLQLSVPFSAHQN